jgi:arabinofuranosyltransferase
MRVFLSLDLPLLASWLVAAALLFVGFRRVLEVRDEPTKALGLGLLLSAGVLAVHAALYARYTVDDAFISFRFARNWAEGMGPVFQAGDRVEGFSSFLWVALLALASSWHLDIEVVSKVLGFACTLATLVAAGGLATALRPDRRVALLAPLLLAITPLFAAWTLAGMEAPLFAALLCCSAWLLVLELREPRRFPASALGFALLVLVRPEGFLFAAIALGCRSRDRLRWAALFAAPAGAYWVARWMYFGQFFPNTFYAKTSLTAGRLVSGVQSVIDFLSDMGPALGLAVAVGFATARWRDPAERFVFSSIAAFLGYVAAVGGDVLHLRFYVHILPFWMIVAALGLCRVLDAVGSLRFPTWAALAGAVIWTTLAYHEDARALHPVDQFGPSYVVDNSNNIHRAHIPLGQWLHDHAPAGAHVAVTDIGGFGYYSRLPIVDLYGLTDRTIAGLIHRRAGTAELMDYLRQRNPEMFVLYGSSRGPKLSWQPAQRAWFDAAYRFHSFWPDSPQDKGLVLMVRRDVSLPAASPPGVTPASDLR